MSEPIRELVIFHERVADGYSELKANINEQGGVVMDGADGGEHIRKMVGDWDAEYWVTVSPAWKDTLLLHLLKDKFTSTSAFMAWLKEREIPHDFHRWD
jgi:hypothetical protein